MITKTKHAGRRKKFLDACIAKQQLLIENFKERIKALTDSEGIGNEESFDNQDIANNITRASEINTLNSLLEFANKELEILENLKITLDLDRTHVTPGAAVITNHRTFFISASLEDFSVEGQVYLGISTDSRIYKIMKGRAKGDSFSFKGSNYIIKDIF